MRSMVRAFFVVLLAAAAATAACSLNPQPLPPEDNGFGADGGAKFDSGWADKDASAPAMDAGADLDSSSIDATPDARPDATADASDASDASDAGDAASDAVTE